MYDDLEAAELSIEVKRLQEQHATLEASNSSLLLRLKEAEDQITILNAEKLQLEKNIVSLYNTAMNEIERKDKELFDLRAKSKSKI
jgi:hypothetical protein